MGKRKPYSQLSRTAKFYRDNPKSRKKKYASDKERNARPEEKAKRRELGRKRTAAKKRGQNIEGKDYDHKQGRFIESSRNRGQAEKSRLKGSTRRKRRSKGK